MGTKNVSAIERGVVGVSLSAIKKTCKTLHVSSDSLIMDVPNNLDIDKLNKTIERLKRLSEQQLELALDINNKLLEVFSMQMKR